jgi:hypothetical protein
MQQLMNKIRVVKTGSRAPNEPLLNRSYGSAESRFFQRTQRDAQFKLGRHRGRILSLYCCSRASCELWRNGHRGQSLKLYRRLLESSSRFVAETITTSELRMVHEQLHTGSARKCIHTFNNSVFNDSTFNIILTYTQFILHMATYHTTFKVIYLI